MARPPDLERRSALLDDVVRFLAEHGLADVSLRPMAVELGVSVNTLVHHFGSKDDLIVAALRRSGEIQQDVQARWMRRQPDITQADLMRRWWRWINAAPDNLALVRLGIEAAALEATLGGLPRQVRGEQIGLWRVNIEQRLIAEGIPESQAVDEASIAKATFTGLVVDLLATGERRRLTRSLEIALTRLELIVGGGGRPPAPARR